jgi:hypothetical protein
MNKWIKARLKEPSTLRGFLIASVALVASVAPEQAIVYGKLVAGIVGLLDVLTPDNAN